MCKHVVISKTESTSLIATLPEEDRAAAIGSRHEKFGYDRTCRPSSGDMHSNRQTHRHADRHKVFCNKVFRFASVSSVFPDSTRDKTGETDAASLCSLCVMFMGIIHRVKGI